jgi:hypothetical protein
MEAILLSLGIFAFLTLFGCAIFSIVRHNNNLLQQLLVAPILGLSVTLILCFFISRWGDLGIPVKSYGPWMTLGISVFSLVVLGVKRPILPLKRYLPYLALILLGFFAVSWGMFLYGFSWISFGNDDWTVYCMAAEDFLNHGYWEAPTAAQYILEPSRCMWPAYGLEGFPPGRVLIRSLLASVTGLSVHEVSMPILMAGQMMLISGGAALTLRNKKYRKPALLAMVFMVMMGLNSLAMFYQVTGQVLGTTLLLGSVVVFLQPFSRFRRKSILRIAVTATIMTLGILVCYMEMYAVLFSVLLFYAGWSVVSRGFRNSCALMTASFVPTAIAICVLQKYFFQMLWYVFIFSAPAAGAFGETGHGGLEGSLMRYFILPDGLIKFWSVIPLQLSNLRELAGMSGVPFVFILLSICGALVIGTHYLMLKKCLIWRTLSVPQKTGLLFAICFLMIALRYCLLPVKGVFYENVWELLYSFPLIYLGVVLTLTAVLFTLWRMWRRDANAIVTFLMMGLIVLLVRRGNDFGTFKMSMIIQPFLWGCVATAIYFWKESLRVKVAFCAPILALGLVTQCVYLVISCGDRVDLGGAFMEVTHGSRMRIVKNYRDISKRVMADRDASSVVFDSANIVLMKMSTSYFKGLVSYFPTRTRPGQVLAPATAVENVKGKNGEVKPLPMFDANELKRLASTSEDIVSRIKLCNGSFDLHGDYEASDRVKYAKDEFQLYGNLSPALMGKKDLWVIGNPSQTILNRSSEKRGDQDFWVGNWSEQRNHLIQIHSALGQHYYNPENRRNISMFQLQRDYFFKDSSFSWLGRYLLMQVVNSSGNVRLLFSLSCSLMADGANKIPPVVVIGDKRQNLPVMGRGSARVFSSPFVAQEVQRNRYIGLEMGAGQRFPDKKTGLMLAYNASINIDWRILSCMGRDISLFSQDEYERLTPPAELSRFPEDLENVNLEYSGMYEDGWVSEDCFFYLSQPGDRPVLEIRGFIPEAQKQAGREKESGGVLKIIVDGKEVVTREVGPGSFQVEVRQLASAGKRKVELHFSRVRPTLSALDRRPTAAFLNYIGFKSDRSSPVMAGK